MICDKSGLLCMEMSIEDLWGLSDQALIRAYVDARRRYAEGKLARDTQRARLEWMRAKAFVNGTGNVTERRMAVDVSEELARKGQEVRETTRDVDLLKIDVDVIEIVIRLRGLHGAATVQVEDPADKPVHQEPE
ncbi:hypothetical protein [Bradyrhizobium ivorense]|uniref:hypothetical protein n=1 Tax=Bradyrhizobium ivorense TaxID=2511166 RepID=UPI001E65697E|nr:hypothetical protein [Bradyrhizobium ivorense]